jgi:hypothetical protein
LVIQVYVRSDDQLLGVLDRIEAALLRIELRLEPAEQEDRDDEERQEGAE